MNPQDIFVIAIWLLIAIGTLARAVWIHRDKRDDKPADNEDQANAAEPWYCRALWIVIATAGVIGWANDTLAAEPSRKPRLVALDLNQCPDKGEDGLPIVVFIVGLGADGKPVEYTCARVTQRSYATTRRPRATH